VPWLGIEPSTKSCKTNVLTTIPPSQPHYESTLLASFCPYILGVHKSVFTVGYIVVTCDCSELMSLFTGHYEGNDERCYICDWSCETCFGPNSNNCLSCHHSKSVSQKLLAFLSHINLGFLAERCNFNTMSGYCHNMSSVCRLSVRDGVCIMTKRLKSGSSTLHYNIAQ